MSTGEFARLARIGVNPYKCLAGAIIDRARDDCGGKGLSLGETPKYKQLLIMVDAERWLRDDSWCDYLFEAFDIVDMRDKYLADALNGRDSSVYADKQLADKEMTTVSLSYYTGITARNLARVAKKGHLRAHKKGRQWMSTLTAVLDAIGKGHIRV